MQNYELPENFLVVATQNPREFEGTFPLPESQLDRFMLRVDLSYPTREHELAIIARYGNADAHARVDRQEHCRRSISPRFARAVEQVHVAPELSGYVIDLAAASRSHAHVSLGAFHSRRAGGWCVQRESQPACAVASSSRRTM